MRIDGSIYDVDGLNPRRRYPMIITARLKAKQGKEKKMEALLTDMVKKVTTEPGALAYTIHRSTVDPSLFMIYEKYTDKAAFSFHKDSPHFAELGGSLGEILDGAPDLQVWEEVAAIKR
jgi:quinol monooxygenase YgiN